MLFLLISSTIVWPERARAKSIFPNIPESRPYLERGSLKPLKSRRYLSLNSKVKGKLNFDRGHAMLDISVHLL